MTISRLARLLVTFGAVLVFASGCGTGSKQASDPQGDSTSPSTGNPSDGLNSALGDCHLDAFTSAYAGGILTNKQRLSWGLNNLGKSIDAFVIPLTNCGTQAVRITGVKLTSLEGYSLPLMHGAFVAPPGSRRAISVASNRPGLRPANGYVLKPLAKDGDEPVLGIRVGAAKPGTTGGHSVSANKQIVLTYQTADGSVHTAVYNTRFGIPNKMS